MSAWFYLSKAAPKQIFKCYQLSWVEQCVSPPSCHLTDTWENQFKAMKTCFGSLFQRLQSKPTCCFSGNLVRSSCSPCVIDKAEGEIRHIKPHLHTPAPSIQVHLLKFQCTGKTKHSVCEPVENMSCSDNNNDPSLRWSWCPNIHHVWIGICLDMESQQITKLRSGHLGEHILAWLSAYKRRHLNTDAGMSMGTVLYEDGGRNENNTSTS